MNKNRIILMVGLLSVLLVTMAVSRPFTGIPSAEKLSWPPRPVIVLAVDNTLLSDYHERQAALKVAEAADFYQRHPDWASIQQAVIPVTGSSEASDYFQRHSEGIGPAGVAVDVTDYFLRHPERNAPTDTIDLSDYFLRH
jgi:hypothetical protein